MQDLKNFVIQIVGFSNADKTRFMEFLCDETYSLNKLAINNTEHNPEHNTEHNKSKLEDYLLTVHTTVGVMTSRVYVCEFDKYCHSPPDKKFRIFMCNINNPDSIRHILGINRTGFSSKNELILLNTYTMNENTTNLADYIVTIRLLFPNVPYKFISVQNVNDINNVIKYITKVLCGEKVDVIGNKYMATKLTI